MRPDWDTYFMEIAQVVATRSTCKRRQVGAVIVRDNRIISTGYNGAPSGLEHCETLGCEREKNKVPSGERHELCRGLHAEQNAIIQAAVYGVSVKEGTIYTTHEPCSLCAKILVNAGIKKIVCKNSYPDKLAREILKAAKIPVITLASTNKKDGE